MIPAISISNVTVKYNKNLILENINLSIENGQCIIITGSNGCGKTTLLKIINGLTSITTGTIKIFGTNLNNKTKKTIGYIPQTNYFSPYLPISVEEAISVGLFSKNGIFKHISNTNYNKIKEIAKNLSIENILNTPIGKLSGGQLQKVSIARVLLQESKIILMDEPLNNLDKQSQNDILEIINSLHKQNITILFVTHNLETIPKYYDKIINIKNKTIY